MAVVLATLARPCAALGFVGLAALALVSACGHQPASERPLLNPGERPASARTSAGARLDPGASVATHAATADAILTPSATANRAEVEFGSTGPLVFAAAGKSGRWLAYCQARRDTNGDGLIGSGVGVHGQLNGDALAGYVFVSGIGELEVDALLGNDPSGRWLVVQQGSKAVLVDAELAKLKELASGAVDTRADALPFAEHRGVTFDPSGASLVYATRKSEIQALQLLTLSNGRQTQLSWGAASLWRVEFAPDGRWLVLQTIPEDTNGNGRLGWPVPELAAPNWRCQGPIPRFPSWLDRGDKPVTTLLRPSGGPPISVPNFVAPFGDAYLTRQADGRLQLQKPGARPLTLSDAACNAHIAHADAQRGLLVVGCVTDDATERPKLELVGVGFRKALGIDVGSLAVDRWPAGSPRLVALYPGKDSVLLDMQRRELLPLEAGDSVLATEAHLALIRRQQTLVVYNALNRSTLELTSKLVKFPDALITAHKAVVAPVLVDWFNGKVLGTFAGRPLALADDGRVLVAAGHQQSATELASGPLRWLQPQH